MKLKLRNLLPYGILLLLLTMTTNGYAHAVITKSSLHIAAIAPNLDTRVSLQFNSQIEIGLSRIFLVSSGDILTPLIISPGKKPGEIIIDMPALASGEYAIKLKVFAADGHLTEDILHFSVTQ